MMRRWTKRGSNPCATHCRGGSRPAAWRLLRSPDMHELEGLIDAAWERRASLGAADAGALRAPLDQIMDALEAGTLRVAEPDGKGGWRVNQWLKRANLLYFRAHDVRVMDGGPMAAFDNVPPRFA